MTIRPEAVDLILDCLENPDTDLDGDMATWKHADSRPVTDAELALLRTATGREVVAAADLGFEIHQAAEESFSRLLAEP